MSQANKKGRPGRLLGGLPSILASFPLPLIDGVSVRADIGPCLGPSLLDVLAIQSPAEYAETGNTLPSSLAGSAGILGRKFMASFTNYLRRINGGRGIANRKMIAYRKLFEMFWVYALSVVALMVEMKLWIKDAAERFKANPVHYSRDAEYLDASITVPIQPSGPIPAPGSRINDHAGFNSGLQSGYFKHRLSVLSFAFASATVDHCKLPMASFPPHSKGIRWSFIHPGQAPYVFPVEGHGWAC